MVIQSVMQFNTTSLFSIYFPYSYASKKLKNTLFILLSPDGTGDAEFMYKLIINATNSMLLVL
jgi:hypothetical protein